MFSLKNKNTSGLPAVFKVTGRAKPAHLKKTNYNDYSSFIFSCFESAAMSVFVVILIMLFIFRVISVDGMSMQNTLQDTDRVVISNLFYTPSRGDIVVLSREYLPDTDSDSHKPIIKRIIALSGQTVNVRTVSGKCVVEVDGIQLTEPYIKEEMYEKPFQVSYPYTVPDGCVFVMGDNRNGSRDSRYADVGAIDERYILGRAILRILPLDEIKTLF